MRKIDSKSIIRHAHAQGSTVEEEIYFRDLFRDYDGLPSILKLIKHADNIALQNGIGKSKTEDGFDESGIVDLESDDQFAGLRVLLDGAVDTKTRPPSLRQAAAVAAGFCAALTEAGQQNDFGYGASDNVFCYVFSHAAKKV